MTSPADYVLYNAKCIITMIISTLIFSLFLKRMSYMITQLEAITIEKDRADKEKRTDGKGRRGKEMRGE